jgi:DNA repair protein RecN (Recombination protein N)
VPPKHWRSIRRRLEAAEARLFDIRGLARKHRVEADALAALGEELAAKLALIEAGGERIAALEIEVAEARGRYDQAAGLFRQKRLGPQHGLTRRSPTSCTRSSSMRQSFRTAFSDAEPGASGIDRVEFEVSTNPGAPFGPLTRIASGGELSRFILALKVALAEAGTAQTMIFDDRSRRRRRGGQRDRRAAGAAGAEVAAAGRDA